MFGLFIRVLEKGKFLFNKMAELVTAVKDLCFRSICIQEFLRGLKIAKLLRLGTLAATNRRRNPKRLGKSDVNGKSYDVYRQHSGGGMK